MDSWLERDQKSVWHPFTPNPHFGPKTLFTRAEGSYVFDHEGRRYFDSFSSWWCNLHGHCHPRLVEALRAQAARLDQVAFAPHSHPLAIELAENLLDRVGSHFGKVFYSDDGSTAVETALKIAMQYWRLRGKPERRLFMSMENAYHGDTLGAVGVGSIDAYHGGFGQLALCGHHVRVPVCRRCPTQKHETECVEQALKPTLEFLEKGADSIAALIVEPLCLAAGGFILYPPAFLDRLVTACRKKGILIIFDEVFTGFGRTGTFFAMDQVKNRPDMVCLSKGLTSGLIPLAATVVTPEIFAEFDGGPSRTFYHGHTFTANAPGCAVALESLRLFKENNVLERNGELQRLISGELARFWDLPRVGDVRQLGMIGVIELISDRPDGKFKSPSGPGWSIASAMWEKGIWSRPLHQTVYLVPPYCSTERDLQDYFSVLYSEIQNEKHFIE